MSPAVSSTLLRSFRAVVLGELKKGRCVSDVARQCQLSEGAVRKYLRPGCLTGDAACLESALRRLGYRVHVEVLNPRI